MRYFGYDNSSMRYFEYAIYMRLFEYAIFRIYAIFRVAQLAEHWASIPKVVGSYPTVARHIFQSCPVWIYLRVTSHKSCIYSVTTFEMTWLMCRLIKFSNDASQQITTLLYIKRACEFKQVTYY